MNPGSRRELTIETPLAVLLTLAHIGYDSLDMPPSKEVSYVAWAICVGLVIRSR